MTFTPSVYKLKKGSRAPDFLLPGADGKTHSLSDFRKARAVLIIFMCNHCPYVKVKLAEINRIARDFKNRGLVVVGINSNESYNYPEDSFENMKLMVQRGPIDFIYLHDNTQDAAKAYGAVCTPDPFLLDGNFKLIFHSRIDDPPGLKEAKRHEMYEAIQEFLDTSQISIKENPSMGCNIKWK
ncbi:MAG: thioredoxin family protein [Nanoarchaeota archaeon]